MSWYVNGIANGNAVPSEPSTPQAITPHLLRNRLCTFDDCCFQQPLPGIGAVAIVTVVGPGQVASTANAQVALYTIAPLYPPK